MTKGVVPGEVDLCLRRITSSPSQTLRRRLVRTTDDGRRGECSARRLLPFVSRLRSGPRLVDRIGSGVRVIVSIKIPAGSCPTMSYEVMIKGVVLARGLTSSPAYIRRARHKHFVVVLCEQRTTDADVSALLDACRRSSRLFHTSRFVRLIKV